LLVTAKLNAVPAVTVALAALVMVGTRPIVIVNVCEVRPEELVAKRLIVYTPLSAAAGVPDRVAVPAVVPALNVIPAGSAPCSLIVGVGVPVAVTVKLPATPAVNVVDAALVITRLPLITVKVNDCVAVEKPFFAVMVSGNVPTLADVKLVPAILAVPSLLSVKVTPGGSAPDSEIDGAG
jgi:hypothetical protein